MRILRHARFAVTMEIYTQVSSTATRDALKRLGASLTPWPGCRTSLRYDSRKATSRTREAASDLRN